ncbi:hypothetical protein BIFANG_03246 [Bifidobacterium angulatum DSM 20098 = JCM 7096]|uniref:Uncharacterized protein n=1 Tax=Bifidobacterium angulatum DSM 20098 = JCM 7096 TaxID=518635 RepID=C4FFY1_9BIFI|nr:hypothetical protein BIFANG_03246 [Bifidobacterium angulatum DSM 20098 = JCM 7096]
MTNLSVLLGVPTTMHGVGRLRYARFVVCKSAPSVTGLERWKSAEV